MKLRRLGFHVLSRLGFYREIRIGRTGSPSPDHRVFYVIRRANRWGEAGFFSNYFYVLAHYAHALQNGFIPIIDMRNYPTQYSERCGVNGERNAWNYYFLQPHSTREAYRSGRFVLSDCSPPAGYYPIAETNEACTPVPNIAQSLLQLAKNDLSIRPELEESFQAEFNAMFAEKRVLGVHYRGGDKRNPPPGHRRAVAEEALLQTVVGMTGPKPDAVFLASDEDGVAELLGLESGLPVVQLQACRLPAGSRYGLHTNYGTFPRPLHRYLLGLEVLRDAWFLSRCDSLVCGHSNVSNAALFWRGTPYEELRIVDTGAPFSG